MCFMVYMGTDCPDDMSLLTTASVRFGKVSSADGDWRPGVLEQPNVWYVGSAMGCSCEFLHLHRESESIGFDCSPEWESLEEDEEYLQDIRYATQRLYDILKAIVDRGYQISLVDFWCSGKCEDIDEDMIAIDVSLSQIGRDKFRLFDGYVFCLKA